MKKSINFYLLCPAVAALMCLSACDNEDPKVPEDYLSADTENLLFKADDQKEELVTVDTNVSDWNYDCPDTWVRITKDGKTFKVKVEKNEGITKRDSQIELTAGTAQPFLIPVTQSGAQPLLTITPPDGLTFAYNATERQEIEIAANYEWSYEVPSNSSQISILRTENKLSILPTANTEENPREFTIRFTAVDNDKVPSVSYTITQEKAEPAHLGNFTATATPLGMMVPAGLATWDCTVSYHEASNSLIVDRFAGVDGLVLLLDFYDVDDIELSSNTQIASTPQGKPISQCVYEIENGAPKNPLPFWYTVEWHPDTKTYTFDLEDLYLGILIVDGTVRTPVTDAYSSLTLTKK